MSRMRCRRSGGVIAPRSLTTAYVRCSARCATLVQVGPGQVRSEVSARPPTASSSTGGSPAGVASRSSVGRTSSGVCPSLRAERSERVPGGEPKFAPTFLAGCRFTLGGSPGLGMLRAAIRSTCVILCTMGRGAFKRRGRVRCIVACAALVVACAPVARDLPESTPLGEARLAPGPAPAKPAAPESLPPPADNPRPLQAPPEPGQADLDPDNDYV